MSNLIKCPLCGAGVEKLIFRTYVDLSFKVALDENNKLIIDRGGISQISEKDIVNGIDDVNGEQEIFCASCGEVSLAHVEYENDKMYICCDKEQPVQIQPCEEFYQTGLLMFINSFLHIFGWAICYNPKRKILHPAKVVYRGFSEGCQEKSYLKLTEYMAKKQMRSLSR